MIAFTTRRFVLAAAALVLVAGMAVGAATGSASAPAGNSAAAKPKPRTIGMIASVLSADVQQRPYKAAKLAAAALGWKLIVIDGRANPQTMAEGMRTLVNTKVDAILLNTMEPYFVQPGLQAAKKAGIPVIQIPIRSTPSPLVAAIYGGDEVALTNQLIDRMERDLPAGAKIAALFLPGFFATEVRKKAFLARMKTSDLKVVATHDIDVTNFFPDAAKGATDILAANPDLDAFWSCCDVGPIAAGPAIIKAGSKAIVYSYLAPPSVQRFIRLGKAVVIDQDHAKTVYVAFDQLVSHFEKGTKIDPKAMRNYPLHTVIFDKKNAKSAGQDAFDVAKLLVPFKAKWTKLYGK